MQTYLCSRCNQKVTRAELVKRRKECGRVDCDLTLHKGFWAKLGGGFKGILFLGLAVVLAGLSLFLGRTSFNSLAEMRQLERVPRTTVRAALEGEINLRGQIQQADGLLRSPKTNTACVYYRYMVEREETDSDGDTTWRTIRDDQEYVPFYLEDSTGSILIFPSAGVDFSVRESWQETRGDYRYTEWRLEVREEIFAFGYAVAKDGTYEVRFDLDGAYTPILSEYGETRERTGMAGMSIAACWVGLVLLAAALSIVITLLRVHRLLIYFSLLNLLVAVYLVVLGLQMMKLDLQSAVERLNRQEATTKAEVVQALSEADVSWDGDWESLPTFDTYRGRGLSDDTLTRLRELRLHLARATHRVRHQRAAFPERFLAPLWRVPAFDTFPLPFEVRGEMQQGEAQFEKAKIPPLIGLILIGVSLISGLVAFKYGFKRIRFKRCMENLPTVATSGAAYGLSELKGVVDLADSADLLKGPLSHQPCVQYHYVVREKRGSGKKTSWVTIVNQKHQIPFLCRDGEGAMLVDPAGSEIHTFHRSTRHAGRRRYSETRLEIGDPLYAIGECGLDPASGETLYLRKPEERYPFILGNRSEHQIMLRVARSGIILLNVSFAAILLTALLLFGLSGSFAATDYLAAALTAPLFMSAVTLMLHYNDLVFLREQVRRNGSNIDVSLKKRHDLVPQLESITSALQEHERGIQTAVTELRTHYSTPSGNLEEQMQSGHAAVNQLILSAEAYPNLVSDTQSALLMRTLITLENEISLMRNGYNDAVETYNTRIQSVPDVFFAKLFHFKDMPLTFADSEVIRIPPSIQMAWEQEQIAHASPSPESEAEPETQTPAKEEPASPALLAAAVGPKPSEKEELDITDIHALIDALAEDPADPLQALEDYEKHFDEIRTMPPAMYRLIRSQLRQAMEQDSVITFFEFALMASISRHLDPAFGLKPERPIRHRNMDLLIEPVSVLLSLIAKTEETEETAGAAFLTGVDNLNHADKDAFTLQKISPDNLAGLEEVLEEIAHAAPMIRANILYACEAAVKLNDDATLDQVLLLRAIADWLERPRPDWV